MNDLIHHPFDVRANVFVPKAQNKETLVFQVLLTMLIAFDFRFRRMRSAIDFNDEASSKTRKIDNELIDRNLLPKPVTIRL